MELWRFPIQIFVVTTWKRILNLEIETRECKTESRSMVNALATASHTSCAPFRRSSAPDDRLAVGCVNEWVSLSVWHSGSWSDWRGGMQQVWQQKLPFTFAHATAATTAVCCCRCSWGAWPNAGLGVCVPRQARRWSGEWRVDRVQTCVTGCNQAASQPGSQLQGSWHTCYKFPWPAHSLGATLGVGLLRSPLTHTHTHPQTNPHNPHSRPIESKPAARLSLCLTVCLLVHLSMSWASCLLFNSRGQTISVSDSISD